MDDLMRSIRIGERMRDELNGLQLGSWAHACLSIEIARWLYKLGGIAGEW